MLWMEPWRLSVKGAKSNKRTHYSLFAGTKAKHLNSVYEVGRLKSNLGSRSM